MWSGQTVSRLGDSLYTIALAWWVLEKTGSATVMGTVLVFSMTPMLVFLLVGGVVVDRLSRLRVMLLSDILSGTVVAAIALLAMSGRLEVWHIYIASTVFGLVAAFFYPAYTAAVPEVTPEKDLPSANSLTALSRQFVGVAGPAIGAAIVAVGGTSTAFALDGVSFFISAACLAPLFRFSSHPQKAKSSSANMLGELREGIGVVVGSPWLWITIAIASLGNVTFSGPTSVALPFLVKDNLKSDVGLLGTIFSLVSFGSIIAAIWLGHQARIRHRGPIAYGVNVVGGSMLVLGGLAVHILDLPAAIVTVLIGATIYGASIATFTLIWTNTLQELVPRHLLGRVSSIDYLGSFVFLPIGYAFTGWATDQVGAPLVFVIGGAIGTGLSLLGLLHPGIHALD